MSAAVGKGGGGLNTEGGSGAGGLGVLNIEPPGRMLIFYPNMFSRVLLPRSEVSDVARDGA